MRSSAMIFAAVLLCAGNVCGQNQEVAQPVFRAGAGEVLVDIVVRDKGGKLTRDLKAGDVAVFENGTEQKITSFRPVHSPGTMRADKETTVQTAAPSERGVQLQRQIRLVSLVFGGMDNDGRRNARQAALDFIEADYGPNVYYAVFYVNRTFYPVLPYTNDRARIKAAIDRITGWIKAPTGTSSDIASARAPGMSAPTVDVAPHGPNLENTLVAMAEFNARMDLNMFGSVDIFSLWGIISELGRLPGRKSVLYFSEGLGLPFDYRQHYLSMISAANRANVAIYTIDARGLFTASDMMKPRENLQQATSTTQDVTTRAATEGSGGYGGAELGMDRAMQSLYDNPQQNLFDLAEKTGGFLIANMNDYRKPMRQLAEDFNTYYELTYRPSDDNYNGRFRAITVKVNRPNAKVQAREGYFALPPMEGQAVFPYEVPLLLALGRPELPRELKFQSRVLQYRGPGGVRKGALVFDMALDQMAFMKDEKGLKAKQYASFLALIKDEQGRVVSKLSRDLPVEVPIDRVPAFRQGRSIITRTVTLFPGRYTLESVISDNIAGKMAARKAVLIVRGDESGPAISDMSLVRRVDPAAEAPDLQDPLQLPSGRVVPTLQEDFRSGPGGQLAAFIMLYPEPSGPAPALYLDLLRDGKVVRRAQPELPKAGDGGAIPVIARISTESIPPGVYELRAAMLQGSKGDKRSMAITIE